MTNVFELEDGFEPALAALRAGKLVGVPTETVYGLAADATNAEAVSRIYAAKGRPSFNPLICHVSGLEMAERLGRFSSCARQLAAEFWPGPLTLVVPLENETGIAPAVTAGLDTIALRHPLGIMAKLSKALNKPIAAPSANSSGKISPTMVQHVADDLGSKIDIILDGGPCKVGIESTIVKVEAATITLLREGGVPREMLADFLHGPTTIPDNQAGIEAPGQLLAHYAPSLPVRLEADAPLIGEAYLAFGPYNSDNHINLTLSETGNLAEAAHNLFAMLKKLDGSGATAIAVHPIPEHGLGAAINDRLKRAAHRDIETETGK